MRKMNVLKKIKKGLEKFGHEDGLDELDEM